MQTLLLDPCVVPPVEAPVVVAPAVETLSHTGLDSTSMVIATVFPVVLIAAGVYRFLKARTLRGKLTVFLIPALLLGGLTVNSAKPAFATPGGVPGAPSVVSEASIFTNWFGISNSPRIHAIAVTTEAVFENPEACGVLSYQWQTSPDQVASFVNYGAVVFTTAPAEVADCVEVRIQLVTTLTNSSGSASSISNVTGTCD